ncbi:MAG: patatin-like phospholipase family protein [Armatimonadetes bacterium]|nr:patatin-like phospholipase family protein [Armatimonadota bacterium]
MPDHGDEAGPPRGQRVDLVFEGGGVKGIGLVGALSVLEERGFVPQNVAGTSAGALVAVLHAAGYSASELREIILKLDLRRFLDAAWEDRIPVVGMPLSILLDQGIYEGDAFLAFVRGLLEAKRVRTFSDLIHPEFADQPRYRYRAQVIVSDLTERRLLVLPRDAQRLGVRPDDLDVALSVRMSMSIPIFFEPVRFRHARTGRVHLIVDGGMLSNFPVWLFDTEDEPPWPTFGLLLVEPDPRTPVSERLPRPEEARGPARRVVDYLKSIVLTMLEAHDRLYVESADFARTIPIPTLGIGGTEFHLPRHQAMALYESGRIASERFLSSWDFEGYVAEFRQGKDQSRRREIAGRIRRARTLRPRGES